MRRILPFLVCAGVFVAGQALAGVVVTATETDLTDNKASATTIYLDQDRMKVADGERVMIFRGDLKRMWTLNAKDHSYIEITPDSMKQMQDRLAGVRAQMDARLAQLPPEQRARIEAMMKSSGGGPAGLGGPPGAGAPAAAEKIAYVKAGVSKTVGAWRCDVYSKTVNGTKEEDLCIAPVTTVGLNGGDFQAMKGFADMMGAMTQQNARGNEYFSFDAMSKAIGFQGIPVETVFYTGGKAERKNALSKVDRTAIPGNAFELPAGYKKQEIGGSH
jgi:hypothetical protein